MQLRSIVFVIVLLVASTMSTLAPAITVNVDFQGVGTAGVSYSTVPGTAVFPAGSSTGTFNLISGVNFITPLALRDAANAPTGISLIAQSPLGDGNAGDPDNTTSGTPAFQDALVTLGPNSFGAPDGSQKNGLVTLTGLNNSLTYNLYLFGYFSNETQLPGQRETGLFTVNGSAPQFTTGADSITTGFTLSEDYVVFSGVAPIAGAIAITFTDNTPSRDVGVFNGLQLTSVPEPSSLVIAGMAFAGLAMSRRRVKK